MKQVVRANVFETNSSSTHAICISKKKPLRLSWRVVFRRGEFGWGFRIVDDVNERASYLYEALIDYYEDQELEGKLNHLKDVLAAHDIEFEFDYEADGWYYIDHSENLGAFLDAVMNDDDMLIRYLFGESFIVVGNDNTDYYADYMYDEDKKGNRTLRKKFENHDVFRKGN